MKRPAWFRAAWHGVNLAVFVFMLVLVYGTVREYSTREYLRGFADAVVPSSATTEQKVEAILAWMQRGPARRTTADPAGLSLRDPEETLNYQQLLQVCGTATNAFVNLAASSGLQARRLLLLSANGQTKHVVAEVFLDGRWAVADPAFHALFRDDQGLLLTRQQLRDPRVFQHAISRVPHYPPEYTYEITTHVRLAGIPIIGRPLRRVLDRVLPSWEESSEWTLLLERRSFAIAFLAALSLLLSLSVRLALAWYGSWRLGIVRVRLRDNFLRATHSFFTDTR